MNLKPENALRYYKVKDYKHPLHLMTQRGHIYYYNTITESWSDENMTIFTPSWLRDFEITKVEAMGYLLIRKLMQ